MSQPEHNVLLVDVDSLPTAEEALAQYDAMRKALAIMSGAKFNPNHDEQGRFAESDGTATAVALPPGAKESPTVVHGAFTGGEKNAVTGYASTNYKDFNAYLRTGVTPDWADSEASAKAYMEPDIAALDTAIAKSEIEQDTTVYRGSEDIPLEGSTFTDKGFISTSLDKNIALKFLAMTDDGSMNHTVIAIHLPPGTRALYVPDAWPAALAEEHEVLLARGSTFRVTGITTRDGVRYADAELVP